MTRVVYVRLGHHSLTCFSRTAASKSFASLAYTKPSRLQTPNIAQSSRDILAPSALSQPSNPRTFSASSKNLFTATVMNGMNAINGINGTRSSKRKQHPSTDLDRPQKQHRTINGKESAGDNTPEVLSMFEEGSEHEFDDIRVVPSLADTAEWQATIEKVVRHVVSIRFCQTCSFDTDAALTSEATGFVVDAERG
jgi:hypothetical protein